MFSWIRRMRINSLLATFLAFVGLASGSTLFFTFSGTVDATGVGLSSVSPLTIAYSYDTALALFPGSNAVYPMDFTVTVGAFTLLGHGVLSVVIQPTYHQVELNAATFVTYSAGYNG